MKTFFLRYKFEFFSTFIVLASAILIYFPALKLNFLLIDDGQIVKNSREIVQSFKSGDLGSLSNILFESEEGRVRPGYWLTQSLISVASFYNPSLMHIFRFLILIASLILIFGCMSKLNIDYRWIIFSIFLYVFNFQNFENYYRLGPTEIFLGLYFLINLNIFLKSKISRIDFFVIFLTSLLGNFTKETYFLSSLPLLFLMLSFGNVDINRNKKIYLFTFVVNIIMAGFVLYIKNSYGEALGYSQNYVFSFDLIINNLVNYYNQINHFQFPVIGGVILYLLYWLYFNLRKVFILKNKRDILVVYLVAVFFVNLAILLPWQFVLGRYLTIVNISLMFLFALFLDDLWSILENKYPTLRSYSHILKNIFMILLVPFIFIRNIFPIANFQDWQKMDSEMTTALIKSLSINIPEREQVFVNYIKGDANIEIYLETKWHLEEFYDRRDIDFVYLEQNNICTKASRYILDRSSDRFVSREDLDFSNLELIDSGKYSYNPLNYGEVAKSFVNIERSVNWSQSYGFEWYIYKQEPNTCLTK